MLDKEEIAELVKKGPYITMQDTKLTILKDKKDGRFTIPRGILSSKMLTSEDKYTLIIIRQN